MTSSNVTAASNPQIPLVRVAIAELRQDPQNARSHDRRNLDAIKESLAKFGQVLPVVVRGGQIVGGNATTIAADELGWTHLDATPADHLSAEEAVALAIALNRTAELASWDASVLVDALAGLPTLEGTGFTAEDLADLELALSLAEAGGGAGLTDPDKVPEPPAEPVTRPGDLWLLGPHRLLCGDATKAEDVERALAAERPGMVFTDPPYGLNIVQGGDRAGAVGGGGKVAKEPDGSIGGNRIVEVTRYRPMVGDDSNQTAIAAYKVVEALAVEKVVFWGGNFYASTLPDASCWLVWDKENSGNFADCELAWTNLGGGTRLLRHTWNGMVRAGEWTPRYHPTQKPVDLATWAFEVAHLPSGTLILDQFAGSGTTLLAAHRTSRRAALMEIDEPYCDLICRRWQEHTGEEPVLEATGEPHDFTT